MKRVHYVEKYLLAPQHPVTVNLIGAGGTGSQVLSCLVRMDMALAGLGHPGLHVTVYDPDLVEQPNVGRQLFTPADIGLNKAQCLVSRLNAAFGLGWEAVSEKFPVKVKNATERDMANIFITCTDNVASRNKLDGFLNGAAAAMRCERGIDHRSLLYWLDFGNRQNTGQVVLGTIPDTITQPTVEDMETVASLPKITEMPGYDDVRDDDSGPSCSLAEALEKQDLFINSTLAQLGCNLLWKMFRHGHLDHRGLYLNLETMVVNPMAV
ncbi:MAG: PRTRC system ThiF family protein [Alistipes sp.]|jgi:PRTRC genetic system ThiF family protein|nr:PRTRC system ThiF family protein [Alistipes sp.]